MKVILIKVKELIFQKFLDVETFFFFLYSRKFSRVLIFAVIADRHAFTKMSVCMRAPQDYWVWLRYPQKLNRKNFPSDQSTKIRTFKNILPEKQTRLLSQIITYLLLLYSYNYNKYKE